MQRIMIFGGPGSGKSTLARQLGHVWSLPVIHMDHLYWKGGWVERDRGTVNALARAAIEASNWVFDGNHSSSMAERADRAQMLVFLDMPRGLRMRRVLWRSVSQIGHSRPDMATNCPERLDWEFLKFSWNYQTNGRLRALRFIQDWAKRRETHILTGPQAVSRFLTDMRPRA